LAYAARSGRSTEGATLYCTLSPCLECAKLIINSGVLRVVYYDQYRITDGIDLLKKANIKCEMLNVNSAILINLQNMFASGEKATLLRK